MVYPSLFLYFFHRLFFSRSYLIGGTIPTSLLVSVKKFLLPFIIKSEVKMVSSKTSRDVGMVPPIKQLHGKTNQWKKYRNKKGYTMIL